MAAVPLFRDTNMAALMSRENTPWSQALRQAKTLFVVFSPDVTAPMLVYRTIAKGSFGNLTLLLCKTYAIFCYCFVNQHGRLITCVKTLYCLFVFHDSLFNLASKSLLSLFLGMPIFGRIRWSHSHHNSSSGETYDRFVRIYSVLWSFQNVLVCFILITSWFEWDPNLYLVSILPRF